MQPAGIKFSLIFRYWCFTRHFSDTFEAWGDSYWRSCCIFTNESVSEKNWKSVNIWRSYGQYYSGLFFFDSQCT